MIDKRYITYIRYIYQAVVQGNGVLRFELKSINVRFYDQAM